MRLMIAAQAQAGHKKEWPVRYMMIISSRKSFFLKRKCDGDGVSHVEMWVRVRDFFDAPEEPDVFKLKKFCPALGTGNL
jgi:hypothetical protein